MQQLGLDNYQGPEGDHRAVLECIQGHRGKHAALPVDRITAATGIADRKARALVKELVEEYGYPIGSCPAGFYMAETEAEILEVYKTFLSWGLSVLRRARAFKRNSRLDEVLGQLTLEYKAVTGEVQ